MNKCKEMGLLWHCLMAMAIQILVGSSVCAQDSSSNKNVGTELGQGIVTRVDVAMYADIAIDIKDLRSLLAAGDIEGVLLLYTNGKNAAISATRKVLDPANEL
jgi:hypothetical protein